MRVAEMSTLPQHTPVWDEGTWAALPTLQGDVAADVCVIGLGGSGLACIGELLEHGLRVVGIDKRSIANGAAGRNGGFLLAGLADFYHDAREHLGRERSMRLYHQTLAEQERIAAAVPDLVRMNGSLRIAASEAEIEDCRRQLAAMQADRLPAEWYDGPAGQGLLIPGDGTFQPLARCRRLAHTVRAAGALLYEHTPALAIQPGRVHTPSGVVRCASIVVAVDGGLERVLPELSGMVRTLRLHMLATAPAPLLAETRPVYRRWGYDYWHQLPDRRIALGGCRDLDPDAAGPAEPDAVVQGALQTMLREVVGCAAPVTHRWAAHVAYSTTHVPVCDEVRPGIWAIGAYSGTGNVVGAVCGRAVAQRIARGATELWF